MNKSQDNQNMNRRNLAVEATYRGLELKMKVQVGRVGKEKGWPQDRGNSPQLKTVGLCLTTWRRATPLKISRFTLQITMRMSSVFFCSFYFSSKMVTYSIPVFFQLFQMIFFF